MAAGVRALESVAGLVDLVIEVRDARAPAATAVVHLHPRLRSKPCVTLLNREDLAESAATASWLRALRETRPAFATRGTSAASLRSVRTAIERQPRRRGSLRVAVVGAPNTGKSSIINGLSRRKRAIARDRPGVTRSLQWLTLAPGIELLDTPGVLAPRITSRDAAWQLAACGSLPETAYQPEEVVERMGAWLRSHGHAVAAAHFDLDEFARAHGMLRKGGEIDRAGAARKLLAQFRQGAFGRFTFELPGEHS